MGKLKDDSNIQIYGWMATKLKLKGNELLIYAVIYSFSRNDNGNGVFNASIPYLQEWTNIASKNVRSCLKNLLDKQLIIKVEDNYSKRKPNVYKINKQILQGTKSMQTGYETTPVQGTKSMQTGYETTPEQGTKSMQTGYERYTNNNIINTKDNTTINTNNNTIINSTISDEEEALGKVCEMYAKEITGKLYCSPHEVKRLTELTNVYGIENVEKAINKAVEYNKKSMVYINGILKNSSKAKKQTEQLPDEYNIPF